MADTRIAVQRQSWRNNEWASETDGHLRARVEIARFRDSLRAAFTDARYKVSDICEWAGTTGTIGHAFIFRDTTFGHEWLWTFFSRTSSGSSWLYQTFGSNIATNLATYAKTFSGVSQANPSSASGWGCMWYNHDTAQTYAMGFTDTTNLTYNVTPGVGDFTAPASSPYSAIASFFPASRLLGIDYTNFLGTLHNKGHVMYDPDIGVMRQDFQYGGDEGDRMIHKSGVVFPLNANGGLSSATDTKQRGIIITQLASASGSTMNVTNQATSKTFVQFFRENGTIENNGGITNILSGFTRSNCRTSGEFEYRKLRVEVSGYVKGFLDPAIINESLPFNDMGYKYVRFTIPGHADKPLHKEHSNFSIMWKKDYPPFNAIPDLTAWLT